MRRELRHALALAAAATVAAMPAAGCGEEEELNVVEGEPLELGELRYNVQITRFLNPRDPEDVAYLEGQRDPAEDESYLGVFMTVENEGEETVEVASAFDVVDTRGEEFESLESESPYALEPGAPLGPDEELPAPDTPAASGPIKGAMLLFLLDPGAAENRPLELEIPSPAGDGTVELDI
jgi:hypothetical protein